MADRSYTPAQTTAEATLASLDWAGVVEALVAYARSEPGRRAAACVANAASAEEVRLRFDEVDEFAALCELDGGPRFGDVAVLDTQLARAGRGTVLELSEIYDAALAVAALDELAVYFANGRESAPRLAERAQPLRLEKALVAELAAAFDESGALSEATYPKLGELRRKIASLERRIRTELDQFLADDDVGDMLQDRYVSIRGDRFVVPVRAQAKNLGLGIVHDASRTGQTVYVEPSRIVPIGNERRMAEAQLVAEEARIARALTETISAHATSIGTAIECAGAIDLVGARRRLAERLSGVRPEVGEEGVVRLLAGRHPVLELEGVSVVANDLSLSAEQPVLVLTGPNAGGKTVALKTVGLCIALVRIGCFVPAAEGSRVDYFRSIEADIGDRQSVYGGLSSFSGHLTALRAMLDAAGEGSLLLLDELASGTDPSQGGALARALIEEFADKGARVVVTTHYAQVKAMASNDARVGVAAMEYLDERPTYRVVPGLAGESHALAAAASVGIDAGVLERARILMDEGERALHDALTELEAERERSAALREELELKTDELARRERTVEEREQKIAGGARGLEREAAAELVDTARAAKKEIGRIVAQLQRAPTPHRAKAAGDAIDALRDLPVEEETPVPRSPATAHTAPLAVGDRVRVTALGSIGEVQSISGDRLELTLGGMRMRARVSEVERLGAAVATAAPKRRTLSTAVGQPTASGVEDAIRTDANTVDLRGMRVADGLAELERFLDDALRSAAEYVFVLHGHGTGAMKNAVRDALSRSPYVSTFDRADDAQGGDGLTVARLAY